MLPAFYQEVFSILTSYHWFRNHLHKGDALRPSFTKTFNITVVTRNSPLRLDVGFITLESDANVKSRQHEYNGSD